VTEEILLSSSDSEYDYNCPVCCEIFKTPVILSCSHSVCKECLQQFWRTKKTQDGPVCRRRSPKENPPLNLALRNLCESFLKERNERRSSGSEEICSLHSEKLKLFCLEDKQLVCLVCRDSQKHASHTFRPISEVVPSYKVGQMSLISYISSHSHTQYFSLLFYSTSYDINSALICSVFLTRCHGNNIIDINIPSIVLYRLCFVIILMKFEPN
uniref:Uncharacterized protein n=1 Tax=Cyprinus carpio TaxID=7962 RepID=A0A8C1PC51_CYPCA